MSKKTNPEKSWGTFQRTLHTLRTSQEVLELLGDAGIDVDRLIGISNAQGPHAKLIRGLMLAATANLSHEEMESDLAAVQLASSGLLKPVHEIGDSIIAQRKKKSQSTRKSKPKGLGAEP